MVYEREDGEEEWVILQAMVRTEEARYILDLGPERPAVPFPGGLEDQVRPVDPEVREIFDGAELYIPFLVEDLDDPEAEDRDLLIDLGFKWPSSGG